MPDTFAFTRRGPQPATVLPSNLDAAGERPQRAASAPPFVRSVTPDGSVVAVALEGRNGASKEVILDRDAWEDAARRYGQRWVLVDLGGGRFPYVRNDTTGKRDAPTVILARHIARAGRDGCVIYRDGDALNLRRDNLEVLSREAFFARDGASEMARTPGRG